MKLNNSSLSIDFINVSHGENLDHVRQLFLEYAQSLNVDLSFQDFSKEFEMLPGKYTYPDGALMLALVDGKPAGCIALRRLSEETCEMKRLFVRESFQGLGIGKELVRLIIEEGRKLGYPYIRLDTLPSMKKAQDMYVLFGFYDIEPYVYNPIDGTRYMELKL
ncbi:MAG: GNAT family N-acetyltransferase [Clostridiales bacterium GWB2_37_7]|nr:MAG: GNAT family N-acetyltransferase [Clostridiales bacterium GWB2_37_7]